jgi:uncharacterized Fe-S cluster-containing radical SAM superfamily protein
MFQRGTNFVWYKYLKPNAFLQLRTQGWDPDGLNYITGTYTNVYNHSVFLHGLRKLQEIKKRQQRVCVTLLYGMHTIRDSDNGTDTLL